MTLPEPLQQVDRTWVQWRGQTLAYFAGCDYFRLASHPEVLVAAESAIRKHGFNVAASRRTTGDHALYHELEAALVEFFQTGAALVISNGYLTNLAVTQALAPRVSQVFLDEEAHGSLVDAAAFSQLPVTRFRSRDVSDLKSKMKGRVRALVMTDGLFARDGAIAPLAEYAKILSEDAWLLVDDSHGAGVLGGQGRGTVEFEKLKRERLVQTTTLSKAFGSFGGVILGSKELCREISEKSAAFAGATPFPLPCAAAALVAIRLLKNPALRERLRENGARVGADHAPILAVTPSSPERLTKVLLERGIFPALIRYLEGPAEGYFRFAISSEHTRAQLDALADALKAAE